MSIADALAVLLAAAHEPHNTASINVVGSEISSYSDLVRLYARVAGVKRIFLRVPSVPYSWVSGPATMISRLPRSVVAALVPSMGEDLVAEGSIAHEVIPSLRSQKPDSIEEAMRRSLSSADGRRVARDDHDLLLSDPEWTGGEVVIRQDRRMRVGRSLWSRVAGTHRST